MIDNSNGIGYALSHGRNLSLTRLRISSRFSFEAGFFIGEAIIRKTWTKRKRGIFLDVLRRTGNVSAAARAADMSRRSVYFLKDRDAEFADDWAAAMAESLDDLEYALRLRATIGTEKTVYYAGKPVGTIRSYADNVGMFLLKAYRPAQFGDGEKSDDNVQHLQDLRVRVRETLERMHRRTEGNGGETEGR